MPNEALKEGRSEVGSSVYVEHLDTRDLAPIRENPPFGAKEFFVGDGTGGSGWHVELPDGSVEPYYVSLPPSVKVEAWLTLPGAPGEHLGTRLEDRSATGPLPLTGPAVIWKTTRPRTPSTLGSIADRSGSRWTRPKPREAHG
jgi:hypothetical protein